MCSQFFFQFASTLNRGPSSLAEQPQVPLERWKSRPPILDYRNLIRQTRQTAHMVGI